MKLLHGIVLSLLLTGCAGEKQLRSVSAKSATMLSGYGDSLRGFAARQSALNSEVDARIHRFEGMRLERASEIGARVDTWRYLDDEQALHRFEVVATNNADELIAAASPQLPSPELPALKYDNGEVGKLLNQLVELQRPVTLQQRLAQLIAFASDVREFEKDTNDASAGVEKSKAVADAGEASVATTIEKPKP